MTAIKKLKNKTTTSSISPLIAVIIIVVITKHQSFISLKLVFDSIPLFKMPAPRNIRNRSSKFNDNISKRGNVSIGKAKQHDEEERKINPYLIGMFLFLVVGSSLAQVLRLFQMNPAIPKDE